MAFSQIANDPQGFSQVLANDPMGGAYAYDPSLPYATVPPDQLMQSGDAYWQSMPDGSYQQVQVVDGYYPYPGQPAPYAPPPSPFPPGYQGANTPPAGGGGTQATIGGVPGGVSQPAPPVIPATPVVPDSQDPANNAVSGMGANYFVPVQPTNINYATPSMSQDMPMPMPVPPTPTLTPEDMAKLQAGVMSPMPPPNNTISTPQGVDPWAAAMQASGMTAGAAPPQTQPPAPPQNYQQNTMAYGDYYGMKTGQVPLPYQPPPPTPTPTQGAQSIFAPGAIDPSTGLPPAYGTGMLTGIQPPQGTTPTMGAAPPVVPTQPTGGSQPYNPYGPPVTTNNPAQNYANSGGNTWYQVNGVSMTPDQYAQYQSQQPQQLGAPALPPGYGGPNQIQGPAPIPPTTYSNGGVTVGGTSYGTGGQPTGTSGGTGATGGTNGTVTPFTSTSQMKLPTLTAPGAPPTIPTTPTIAMPGAAPTGPQLNLNLPTVGQDGSFAGMAGGAPPPKMSVPLVSDQQMNQMLNQAYSQNAQASAGNMQNFADSVAGRGFSTQSSAVGDYQQMQDFARMNADMQAYSQIPLSVQRMNADYMLQGAAVDAQNRGMSIEAYQQAVAANNLNNQAQLAGYGLDLQGYGAQNQALSNWQQAQNDLYGTQAQLYGLGANAQNAYGSLLNQQAQLQLAQQGQDLDAYNSYQAALQGYYGIGNDSRQTDVAAYQAYNNAMNQMLSSQIALMTGLI